MICEDFFSAICGAPPQVFCLLPSSAMSPPHTAVYSRLSRVYLLLKMKDTTAHRFPLLKLIDLYLSGNPSKIFITPTSLSLFANPSISHVNLCTPSLFCLLELPTQLKTQLFKLSCLGCAPTPAHDHHHHLLSHRFYTSVHNHYQISVLLILFQCLTT